MLRCAVRYMGGMGFAWIKRFLPRGLYGRAALILLVPIVTLQLVISAAILQRYFEGVARQMTRAAGLELSMLLDLRATDLDIAATVAQALDIGIAPGRLADGDARAWYDLTGIEVIRVLDMDLPGLIAVDLQTDWRRPLIVVDTADGPVSLSMGRNRLSASNPHQLLVLIVFTGLFMTAVAYAFLRNQLRPIRRLARASEAFGKGQIVPYNPSGASEVRSAGHAFLSMRARIETMLEQRTLMLSGVSHDLRTPLTRMRLGLSMLDQDGDVAALHRDVEEMERLLGTFLDFARSDALDDLDLCDPVALAETVVQDAQRGGGAVRLVAPATRAEVLLRPHAVRRALSNLVSNALRYGQRAELRVVLVDGAVRFSVEDDGPGIPAAAREDALRPFIRLDTARNQDQGSGVGLGLAIANDIARRHGGSLTLGDSARMGGLKIDLVLPR